MRLPTVSDIRNRISENRARRTDPVSHRIDESLRKMKEEQIRNREAAVKGIERTNQLFHLLEQQVSIAISLAEMLEAARTEENRELEEEVSDNLDEVLKVAN